MKHILLTLCLVLSSPWAYAQTKLTGHDQGAGGDGLLIGGKLYSLDLVEAGVQKQPFFNIDVPVNPWILQRLMEKFGSGSEFPVNHIAKKISEVMTVNKVFAVYLLKAIEFYKWHLVDSSLINIYDEDSLLDYPLENLKQIASRANQSIQIDAALWAQLDEGNRTALVLHEVIYALIIPRPAPYMGYMAQSSPRAREVNGYLFTADFQREGRNGFQRILGQDFTAIFGDQQGLLWDLRDNPIFSYSPEYYFNLVSSGVLPDRNSTDEEIHAYAREKCSESRRRQIPLTFNTSVFNLFVVWNRYTGWDGERTYLRTRFSVVNHKHPIADWECEATASRKMKEYIDSTSSRYTH